MTNPRRALVVLAAAFLAAWAPAAGAALHTYRCNVALANQVTVSVPPFGPIDIPIESWDGTATAPPAKVTYFFEFVVDDAVVDTNPSTTQSTFPGAIVSGAFFGPVPSSPTELTTSTTPTRFVIASPVDFEVNQGTSVIDAPLGDPRATFAITVLGMPIEGSVDSLGLGPLPLAANDTGAGQTFAEQVSSLNWEGGFFAISGGGQTIGSGSTTPDQKSNDIVFFTDVGVVTTTSTTLDTPTTSTTLPVEDCTNCLDDDGDGRVDFDDEECCAEPATAKLGKSRLKPVAGGGAALRLTATLPSAGLAPGEASVDAVSVQVRGASDEVYCGHLPASALERSANAVLFDDPEAGVATAPGLVRLRLVQKKNGKGKLVATGQQVPVTVPGAGTLTVTVGLRTAATAEATNRCAAVSAAFRQTPKGALVHP
jgi:hypothetical protein